MNNEDMLDMSVLCCNLVKTQQNYFLTTPFFWSYLEHMYISLITSVVTVQTNVVHVSLHWSWCNEDHIKKEKIDAYYKCFSIERTNSKDCCCILWDKRAHSRPALTRGLDILEAQSRAMVWGCHYSVSRYPSGSHLGCIQGPPRATSF